MRRRVLLVVVGLLAAVSTACQPGGGGLSDQDKAAIRQLDESFVKAVTAEMPDWDAATSAYYAEDAQWMMPNMPTAEGRAAIKAAFSQWPPIKGFELTEVSLEGAGDFAYRHYTYVMTLAAPGSAGTVTDKGKGIEVFEKQADGTWRVIRDVGSSDLPVPGLVIPTATVAADASPEVKKLGDVVGRWRIDGTSRPDPKSPAGPVALSLDCRWFANGLEVVCAYDGSSAGQPYQEADVYSYDGRTKTYSIYSVMNPGGVMQGKLAIQPGTWVHAWDFQAEGKSARARLTLTDVTAAGGKWKSDMSVAGGAWTVTGEGTYVKAR
jgi:ketosteroid isomerase-like protein